MVPVKFWSFGTYYKQKTGQVMKNILYAFLLLFCWGAYAAPTSNDYSNLFGAAKYLGDAAVAWGNVISGFGLGGNVAAYVQDVRYDDIAAFTNAISVLGFNNTTMALYETNNHLDRVFSVVSMPLIGRRDGCVAGRLSCDNSRTLVLDGQVFGSFANYDSNENAEFNTRNTGVSINAKMFVADGLLFGASYTRTMTDTHDNRVYTDATGNSITLFGEYLSQSGFFINMGLNAGHISWAADKLIALIADSSVYDTDFFAGQLNSGMRILRGRISIIPQISMRYTHIMTDNYIDSVAQEFSDWRYDTMTAMAGIDVGYDFVGSDFVVRPAIHIGGGYDVISDGTDNINVRLVGNQSYNIPINAPARSAFNGALGVMFYSPYFNAGINYNLDIRSGYMAHTIGAMLKIGF